MKRLILLAATVAACALPASAVASPSAGVVLTFSSHQHKIQVVDSSHVVHAYRYRGDAKSVRPGSTIHFNRHGGAIGQVRAGRHASRKVTFLATVKRVTSRALTLRLADGKALSFKTRQIRSSGALTPGTKVLATELLRSGHAVAVTIVPSSPGAQASGKGGAGGAGGAGTFDHSPVVSGDENVNGTIASVTPNSVAITTIPGGQTMQFGANPADGVTDDYLTGDQVTVTYNQLADGALKATDVEYLDQDVTGTVLAVSDGSVTLLVDGTASVVTLTDDPSDGMFDGVNVGDQGVDVTYHVATAGLIVDGIDD